MSFWVEVGWSVSFGFLIQFKHGVPLECPAPSLCLLVLANSLEG